MALGGAGVPNPFDDPGVAVEPQPVPRWSVLWRAAAELMGIGIVSSACGGAVLCVLWARGYEEGGLIGWALWVLSGVIVGGMVGALLTVPIVVTAAAVLALAAGGRSTAATYRRRVGQVAWVLRVTAAMAGVGMWFLLLGGDGVGNRHDPAVISGLGVTVVVAQVLLTAWERHLRQLPEQFAPFPPLVDA